MAVACLFTSAFLIGFAPTAAGADTAAPADGGGVTVIEVSGLIDPVMADFIETEIDKAGDAGVVALVFQLNSVGSVIGDGRLQALVEAMQSSEVPVNVWVGPSGSQARGESTRLLAAAEVTGLSAGSRIEVTPELAEGQDLQGITAVGEMVEKDNAVDAGLVDNLAPSIGEFLINLDGVKTKVVDVAGKPQRQPATQVRFAKLDLTGQLMHTVASPAVAYLLFIIGLGLLVFELYTAGLGIAGVVGAGCLLLGSYGLAVLPIRWWALVLLLLAMFGFAIDVQVGAPRFWTAVGTASFVLGSVFLFDGVTISWITLVVGVIGMVFGMISGMPAMVRTRFSTPTIGREWMIGEVGEAVADIDPEGVVKVRDAPWRARTNRATPIAAGDRVRVASIEGLVLEVEPEEGGARDYRERRKKS